MKHLSFTETGFHDLWHKVIASLDTLSKRSFAVLANLQYTTYLAPVTLFVHAAAADDLNCVNLLHIDNPITFTTDSNGIVTAATINTSLSQAATRASTVENTATPRTYHSANIHSHKRSA